MKDPNEMLEQVRSKMRVLADTVDQALGRVPGVRSMVARPYPRVDVYETPEAVVVQAEVPGVAREELDVRVQARTLEISGRRGTAGYAQYEPVSRETPEGQFHRTVMLPAEIDEEAEADAFLEGGLLTVRLKKTPRRKGKTVQVEMR